jgi:Na+/melibiose symporter-like transporter
MYALPGLPLAMMMLPTYIYVPSFYAADLGLSLAGIGLVLLIVRVWDVLTDPIVGWLSDRTPPSVGRRRSWMIGGVPLVLVGVYQLFNPPADAGLIHLALWSSVMHLGATMVLLPYLAWGAEMSSDYHMRTRTVGYREAMAVAGTGMMVTLPLLIGTELAPVLGTASGLLVILLPVAVLGCVLWVREVPPPKTTRSAALNTQALRSLFANRPFVLLLGAYLLNGIANGLPATLFILFVRYRLDTPELTGLLLGAYFGAGLLSIPVWMAISRKFDKASVWTAAMVWNCLIFTAVPFLGPGDSGWFLAICLLSGLSLGADLTLPASMQADVIDLDRWKSGTNREGLFFSLWGVATKLALALSAGIAFPFLDRVGFVPGPSNSPKALFALALFYGAIPILFKVGAILMIRRYPLSRDLHRRLQIVLARQARPAPLMETRDDPIETSYGVSHAAAGRL